MPVLLFQPRFAALVRRGIKLQTIRHARRNRLRPGQPVSLRTWSGAPRRSPQITLRDTVVTSVRKIEINLDYDSIQLDGAPLNVPTGVFAELDGFHSVWDLLSFFQKTHTLPFQGDLIEWEPLPICIGCRQQPGTHTLGYTRHLWCADCRAEETRVG